MNQDVMDTLALETPTSSMTTKSTTKRELDQFYKDKMDS